MHLLRTAAGTFGVAASALVLTGTAASAAPPGDAIPISCDNGSDYTVLVNGNGDWTPGRDTAWNTVLVPTSFGEFHGVVTLVETGEVLDEFTDRRAGRGRRTRCAAPR